jgi:hypothetical protein
MRNSPVRKPIRPVDDVVVVGAVAVPPLYRGFQSISAVFAAICPAGASGFPIFRIALFVLCKCGSNLVSKSVQHCAVLHRAAERRVSTRIDRS